MQRKTLKDALSLNLVLRNLQSLERGVTWVIGLSWLMALLMMGLAVHTLNLSVHEKRNVAAVLASEPQLPQIQRQTVDLAKDEALLAELHKRYPDIHFLGQNTNLVVTSGDGAQFREWLAALEYVDTLAPEWRWSLHEFCVGNCPGHDLMYAVLSAENIVFSAP